MRQVDIIKLVGICAANYRNWPENGKEEVVVALWEKMLADVSFEVAQVAIEKHMSESPFPPTVADIRQRISDVCIPRQKASIEAWGDVSEVIRKYGSYRQEEAMSALSGITKKVVEALGYRYLCLSEDVMADRAHFLKVYDSLAERERKDNLLMSGTRDAMLRIQGDDLKRLGSA